MEGWEKEAIREAAAKLESGQGLNAPITASGWTLLHHAVDHRNSPLIEFLASRGADLEARIELDGWTPLHLAVDADIDCAVQADAPSIDFATCRSLLLLGANLDARTADGRTPRDMAAERGQRALILFDQMVASLR